MFLRSVVLGLVATTLAPAQIIDTGTGGCSHTGGTIPATSVFGSVSIGDTIGIQGAFLPGGVGAFVLVNDDGSFIPGADLACPNPFVFPQVPTETCDVLTPMFGIALNGFPGTLTIAIPNESHLIGYTIYVQTGVLGASCVTTLNRILQLTVTA